MGTLTVEGAEEVKVETCADCGREQESVHGLVYDGGNAYAVYLATMYSGHADKLVCVAIEIGKWDDDSGPDDRQSATIFIRPGLKDFEMTLQDREVSPGGSPSVGWESCWTATRHSQAHQRVRSSSSRITS